MRFHCAEISSAARSAQSSGSLASSRAMAARRLSHRGVPMPSAASSSFAASKSVGSVFIVPLFPILYVKLQGFEQVRQVSINPAFAAQYFVQYIQYPATHGSYSVFVDFIRRHKVVHSWNANAFQKLPVTLHCLANGYAVSPHSVFVYFHFPSNLFCSAVAVARADSTCSVTVSNVNSSMSGASSLLISHHRCIILHATASAS